MKKNKIKIKTTGASLIWTRQHRRQLHDTFAPPIPLLPPPSRYRTFRVFNHYFQSLPVIFLDRIDFIAKQNRCDNLMEMAFMTTQVFLYGYAGLIIIDYVPFCFEYFYYDLPNLILPGHSTCIWIYFCFVNNIIINQASRANSRFVLIISHETGLFY